MDIRPATIAIPQADLDDLRRRLERTRWAQEVDGAGWDYGVPLERVRGLVDYWLNRWDWRRLEARLNRFDQATTTIDGQNVHFLHVRSPESDALPVILTHGWPGSVAEFLGILEPLTNPRAFGADPKSAITLVVPSMPGFGFSGPTTERGWGPAHIAKAWIELMRRLGYERFGVAGNDWGSIIAPYIGVAAPDRVVGIHVTQVFDAPSDTQLDELNLADPEEAASGGGLRWFLENMNAYDLLQSQQPQSIAHALTDSPAGLLAWHLVIYRDWVDPEFILDNVSIHWLTGTAASAMRLYRERTLEVRAATAAGRIPPGLPGSEPTTIPIGLAQFANDTHAIRRFGQRLHSNIVSWNSYDVGGHFAARQAPELLVGDMRQFFARVR